MSTKSKKAKQTTKRAAVALQLGETLKKHMVDSITFIEKLNSMRVSGIAGPMDLQLIGYAGNSELDHFRDLLAKFLTSRGIATTTVEAAPPQAA